MISNGMKDESYPVDSIAIADLMFNRQKTRNRLSYSYLSGSFILDDFGNNCAIIPAVF